MATLTLAPNPWFTGFDDDGVIVPGGKLFTYQAGTDVKLATYTDVGGLAANTNPIILDSAGRVPSGFFLLPQLPQNYQAVMKSDSARFNILFHGLLDRGVYIAPALYEAGFVSSAHSEQDIAETVAAARAVFRQMAA